MSDNLLSEIADEVDDDIEDLFPPKPGGLVDRHRRRKAAEEQAKEEGQTSTVESLGRNKVKAVRTVIDSPDIARATSVLLTSAVPVARLLPRDSHRKSAVVLAVDNDVYVTSDQGTAWNIAGASTNVGAFYLPAGIAVPVVSTDELFVAATTTASTSRVSVMITRESGA